MTKSELYTATKKPDWLRMQSKVEPIVMYLGMKVSIRPIRSNSQMHSYIANTNHIMMCKRKRGFKG